LREELGYEFMNAFIEISPGAKGAFEVYKDDVLVFSKLKLDILYATRIKVYVEK
jgi:hypothetical protein